MTANLCDVVDEYFQNVIKKSWTWGKLTEEEKVRFANMDEFRKIKGSKKIRIEWLNTIYFSFLTGVGYNGNGWREINKEKTPFF